MPKRDSFKTKLDVIHFDPLSYNLHAHLLFYGPSPPSVRTFRVYNPPSILQRFSWVSELNRTSKSYANILYRVHVFILTSNINVCVS